MGTIQRNIGHYPKRLEQFRINSKRKYKYGIKELKPANGKFTKVSNVYICEHGIFKHSFDTCTTKSKTSPKFNLMAMEELARN